MAAYIPVIQASDAFDGRAMFEGNNGSGACFWDFPEQSICL